MPTQRAMAAKIKPFLPPFVMPENCVPFGQTPEGTPLYKLTRQRSRSVPVYEPVKSDQCGFDHKWLDPEAKDTMCATCGNAGHQRHKKHQLTGEELVGIRKSVPYEEVIVFYNDPDGQGNNRMQEYKPPTDKELAGQARAVRRAAMHERLLDSLTDGDLTIEDIVSGAKGGVKSAPQPVVPEEEVEEDGIEYPFHKGAGYWLLSDGSSIRGNREQAEKAEAEIAEAKQVVASEY